MLYAMLSIGIKVKLKSHVNNGRYNGRYRAHTQNHFQSNKKTIVKVNGLGSILSTLIIIQSNAVS